MKPRHLFYSALAFTLIPIYSALGQTPQGKVDVLRLKTYLLEHGIRERLGTSLVATTRFN